MILCTLESSVPCPDIVMRRFIDANEIENALSRCRIEDLPPTA